MVFVVHGTRRGQLMAMQTRAKNGACAMTIGTYDLRSGVELCDVSTMEQPGPPRGV